MSVVLKQANAYLNHTRKRIPSLQGDIEIHEAMITNGMVKFLYPEQPENELNKMDVMFNKPLIPINTLNYQPWQGA